MPIAALGAVDAGARLRVGGGDENRAAHAPVLAVRLAPRLLATLPVERPVVGEILRGEQTARDHAPALAAGHLHRRAVRRGRWDRDRRRRALVWSGAPG